MLGSSSQSASRYRIIPGWPETLVLSSKMWRTSMKFISISRAVRTRAILPSYWSGHQARGKIHGVRHHHRPRDSRSAPDREQDVLVVRYRVRAAAEYPDGSGVAGPARYAAGHEPQGVRAGAQDGRRAACRDCPVHQVGPQELLLPRFAQELSDQPV